MLINFQLANDITHKSSKSPICKHNNKKKVRQQHGDKKENRWITSLKGISLNGNVSQLRQSTMWKEVYNLKQNICYLDSMTK